LLPASATSACVNRVSATGVREARSASVSRRGPEPGEGLSPYARRSKRLEVLIPILHLKDVSTSDFAAALAALLGRDASGLSASTIGGLKDIWPTNMRAN
jgi:putative transposase